MVSAGHRLAVASGGETEAGEEDERSAGPIVELEPDFKRYKSGRKYEGHLFGQKIDFIFL